MGGVGLVHPREIRKLLSEESGESLARRFGPPIKPLSGLADFTEVEITQDKMRTLFRRREQTLEVLKERFLVIEKEGGVEVAIRQRRGLSRPPKMKN